MAVRPDNRLADAPMVPVTCHRCAAAVLVRKSTWDQTSVQGTAAATARCEERHDAQQLAGHGAQGLFLACSALRDSVTDAVLNGEVPIVDSAPVRT